MTRREFMMIVSGAAVFAPPSGFAQETGRTYRLGLLGFAFRRAPVWDIFFNELRRDGFVEGQNLIVDARYDARMEQLRILATELA